MKREMKKNSKLSLKVPNFEFFSFSVYVVCFGLALFCFPGFNNNHHGELPLRNDEAITSMLLDGRWDCQLEMIFKEKVRYRSILI